MEFSNCLRGCWGHWSHKSRIHNIRRGGEFKNESIIFDDSILNGWEALKLNGRIETQSRLEENFFIKDDLGTGYSGTVRLAVSCRTGRQYALKTYSKSFQDISSIRSECLLHLRIDHPYFCLVHRIYEDDEYVNVLMDYCGGGSLLDRVLPVVDAPPDTPQSPSLFHLCASQPGRARYFSCATPLTESEAGSVIQKLLLSLNYLHATFGIIHRDMKLENVLLAEPGNLNSLKLIDFGFSVKINSSSASCIPLSPPSSPQSSVLMGERFFSKDHSVVGTLLYLSPEAINSKYSSKGDMWSLGVLLHVLLTGRFPFCGNKADKLLENIRSGDFACLLNVSPACNDFLKSLLCIYPDSRLSAADALCHPWMFPISRNFQVPLSWDEAEIFLMRMVRYSKLHFFKKIIFSLSFDFDKNFLEYSKILEIFSAFDNFHCGLINRHSFLEFVETRHPSLYAEASEIFNGCCFPSVIDEMTFSDFFFSVTFEESKFEISMTREVFKRLCWKFERISEKSLECSLGSKIRFQGRSIWEVFKEFFELKEKNDISETEFIERVFETF